MAPETFNSFKNYILDDRNSLLKHFGMKDEKYGRPSNITKICSTPLSRACYAEAHLCNLVCGSDRDNFLLNMDFLFFFLFSTFVLMIFVAKSFYYRLYGKRMNIHKTRLLSKLY